MFEAKKLFEVRWTSDFGHATADHAAAVVARSTKDAAKKTTQFFNVAAKQIKSVTERGAAYVHTSVVKETK